MTTLPDPGWVVTRLSSRPWVSIPPCATASWTLTCRPQVVKVGNNFFTMLILNTGAPQGCVRTPLLYSLFTHDCVAMHASNSIIKFADDTTVVGLITNNDETAYREEVRAFRV